MSGCGAATTTSPPEKLGVVATTTQLGGLARNLGGDRVAVTQILRANVDPHDYEPVPC